MTEPTSSRLLALPYDIRFLIYEHLFPIGKYINIEAGRNSHLKPNQDSTVPTAFLRTCRLLHAEASRYLYTNYFFLVFGEKRDCLANYEKLQRTLQLHAQSKIHVHPLSNGKHSQTGAILLTSSDAFSVKARGRGVPVTVEDLRREVEAGKNGGLGAGRIVHDLFFVHYGMGIAGFVLAALMIAVLAWLGSGQTIYS
ncbi:hypothetical protein CBER1_01664 [Cercospora berteroae]|uniref:Uncharacterized protein n=1 Tax=Cercospora berteroae TaxID=357750 RepID=A0A2S6CH74_9PEZI|nr:hypothetical protein CBER1_01664 [Cercospora berteroae]